MVSSQHHLDIKAWLIVLDLQQYEGKNIRMSNSSKFRSFSFLSNPTESFAKFLGVEELMYFDEADIKQLGIRNSAHRARIVSSLVALRDKHQRGPGEFCFYMLLNAEDSLHQNLLTCSYISAPCYNTHTCKLYHD